MTIASATNKSGPYNGNGVTVAFAGTFKISDETHVQVILADADGVETIQTITTNYTVSGVGGSGFTVTMLVAPASGTTLTLIRDVPFTQEVDLQNQGAYYAETIEEALDAGVARDQQLQEQVSRSVKIPASASVDELDTLIANIVLLGDSADDLAALAAISADVETLAAITAAISTVAGISTAVTTVAGISVAVQEVAAVEAELLDVHDALAAILAAPGYAAAADASADAAAASAAAAATFNPALYMLSASYPKIQSIEALGFGGALKVLRMNAANNAYEFAAVSATSRRNLWVNAAFQVSQENGNTLGTTNGYYPADEIAMYFTAATAAMSVQRIQSMRTLIGSVDQIEWKCTTAKASLGASDYVALTTKIEGQRMAHLRWGTASAKPYVHEFETTRPAGTYHIHVTNSAGNRHIAVPYTISALEANTPVRKSVTIPGDTSGTWLTTNGIGAVIDNVLAAGATVTGGTLGAWGATTYYAQSTQKNCLDNTANVVRLADVILAADPDSTGVSPAWELPDYDDTLRQCQRYFGVDEGDVTFANASVYTTTLALVAYTFAEMKAAPVITLSSSAHFRITTAAGAFTSSGFAYSKAGRAQAELDITISGATAGQAGILNAASASARILRNARL